MIRRCGPLLVMIGRVTETFAWTRFDLACAVIGERSLQKVGGANGTHIRWRVARGLPRLRFPFRKTAQSPNFHNLLIST